MKRRKKFSDGHYHERNAVVVLLVLCVVAIVLSCKWPELGAGILVGSVLGLFIEPDLDHRNVTRAENRAYRMLGKILGTMFQIYFLPYTLLGHRSFFTHGGFPPFGWVSMILIATPLRILYTFWWIILIGIIFPAAKNVFMTIPPLFFCGVYGGWGTQDIVHWLRDMKRR